MRPWMRSGAAVLALAAGCEFVRPPTTIELDEEPVVVHAVLAAGSERVSVLLVRVGPERFEPGEPSPYGSGIEPISGADVALVRGADTVSLGEAPAGFPACYAPYASSHGEEAEPPVGPGCYGANLPVAVQSGSTYRLLVRLPNGHTIHGEATPPPPLADVRLDPEGPVPVREQATGLEPRGRVRVRFHAPAGVAGIGLAVRPVAAFVDGEIAADVRCSVTAPQLVVPADQVDGDASLPIHAMGCVRGEGNATTPVSPDSVQVALHVTGFDAAFTRYHLAMQSGEAGADAAAQGVQGALGLFAGEATLERTVTLVPTR